MLIDLSEGTHLRFIIRSLGCPPRTKSAFAVRASAIDKVSDKGDVLVELWLKNVRNYLKTILHA